MKRLVIYGIFWLVSLGAQAQEAGWVLNDLAYALESPANRQEVVLALQQFQENTQVALLVSAEFEQGIYATDARNEAAFWLQKQTHGITVFITLAKDTKAFQKCEMQVSDAVEALLPAEDRQQIRTGLMEFYFRSSPIPTDAYTQGLLAGIEAMEKRILEGKANEQEKLPDDVVAITHLDKEFAAGIDDDKLKIEYAIKKDYVGTLKAAKLEVYKDLAKEPCFVASLDIKEANTYLWDGKLSEEDGDYITYKDSPFTVKITVSEDEKFEKVGMVEKDASVEEFADEWRSYPEIAKRVSVNRSDQEGKKLTQYRYYLMMRNDIISKISGRDFYFLDDYDGNPLNYLSKHIVDAKFLNKDVKVHTNYLAVLQEVEESMGRPNGDFKKYSEDINYSLAGIFYIRYLNTRNNMSNHSFGMAVDVDPNYNPQRSVPTWMFVHILTNQNLLFAKLDPNKMQEVSNSYKSENVDAQRISEVLLGLEKIDKINQEYWYDISKIEQLFKAVNNFNTEYNKLREEIKQIRLRFAILDERANPTEKKAVEVSEKEIANKVKQQIQWLSVLKNNIHDLEVATDEGYDKVFKVKDRFPSEYDYMIKCFETLYDKTSCIETAFNEIFVHESSNLMSPVCQSYSTVFDAGEVTNILSMIERTYEHYEMGFSGENEYEKDRFNLFKKWIERNKNDLIALSEKGFFRLDPSFVQYFLDHKKIRWGGHYNTDIDCMHFELHPNEF